jgi:predicted transcriptional regulator
MSYELLKHKPVNSRKSRPAWALNDRELMLRCVDTQSQLRFQVAQMYWQKNMTAEDVAAAVGLTRSAVKMILSRLVTQSLPSAGTY